MRRRCHRRSRGPGPPPFSSMTSTPGFQGVLDALGRGKRYLRPLPLRSPPPPLAPAAGPSDPVGDEFTVPFCKLRRCGDRGRWWEACRLDAIHSARELWTQTHPALMSPDDAVSTAEARPDGE